MKTIEELKAERSRIGDMIAQTQLELGGCCPSQRKQLIERWNALRGEHSQIRRVMVARTEREQKYKREAAESDAYQSFAQIFVETVKRQVDDETFAIWRELAQKAFERRLGIGELADEVR
jgi:uncharacterized Zn finger protein